MLEGVPDNGARPLSSNHACASLPPLTSARGVGLAAICGLPQSPARQGCSCRGRWWSVCVEGCGGRIFWPRDKRAPEAAPVPWPREETVCPHDLDLMEGKPARRPYHNDGAPARDGGLGRAAPRDGSVAWQGVGPVASNSGHAGQRFYAVRRAFVGLSTAGRADGHHRGSDDDDNQDDHDAGAATLAFFAAATPGRGTRTSKTATTANTDVATATRLYRRGCGRPGQPAPPGRHRLRPQPRPSPRRRSSLLRRPRAAPAVRRLQRPGYPG